MRPTANKWPSELAWGLLTLLFVLALSLDCASTVRGSHGSVGGEDEGLDSLQVEQKYFADRD